MVLAAKIEKTIAGARTHTPPFGKDTPEKGAMSRGNWLR